MYIYLHIHETNDCCDNFIDKLPAELILIFTCLILITMVKAESWTYAHELYIYKTL